MARVMDGEIADILFPELPPAPWVNSLVKFGVYAAVM